MEAFIYLFYLFITYFFNYLFIYLFLTSTRWRWMVSLSKWPPCAWCKNSRYWHNARLGGHQSLSGQFQYEKNLSSPGIELRFLSCAARGVVTAQNTLSQLSLTKYFFCVFVNISTPNLGIFQIRICIIG